MNPEKTICTRLASLCSWKCPKPPSAIYYLRLDKARVYMSLSLFHPAVANWFAKQFAAPTASQERAWPSIKERRHTLIAAPTGSGKTLSAFLAAIDDLVRLALAGSLEDNTHVVYVSPLKALSNDIQKNLQEPLAGIQQELQALGLDEINIRTMVRTGDTPASERTAMIKRPPH